MCVKKIVGFQKRGKGRAKDTELQDKRETVKKRNKESETDNRKEGYSSRIDKMFSCR